MTKLLERLRGGLVVSCQAYPGEPMRDPRTMSQLAQAVAAGGAAGIRAEGPEDIRHIRAVLDLPVVGIWKDGVSGVVITPTVKHALAVAAAGADIVAVDGTVRPRPDGRSLAEVISTVHDRTDALVMADVSTCDEGLAAAHDGADIVATTLSGYTSYSPAQHEPDIELVRQLASGLPVPVLAEGRIRHAVQARAAFQAGAYAVVVGTAITHPTTLTRRFIAATTDADLLDSPRSSEEPGSVR